MEVTTARVVNSTPIELVTLSYELILENLETSINNLKSEKEMDVTISKLLIKDLLNALDMKYDISKKLRALYIFANGELIYAEITKDKENKIKKLEDTKRILNKLFSSFKTLSENERKKESVMKNTDTIYSGLTYGMNGLNETVLGNYHRGLKA